MTDKKAFFSQISCYWFLVVASRSRVRVLRFLWFFLFEFRFGIWLFDVFVCSFVRFSWARDFRSLHDPLTRRPNVSFLLAEFRSSWSLSMSPPEMDEELLQRGTNERPVTRVLDQVLLPFSALRIRESAVDPAKDRIAFVLVIVAGCPAVQHSAC